MIPTNLQNKLEKIYWDATKRTVEHPSNQMTPEKIREVDSLLQAGAYSDVLTVLNDEEALEHDATGLQAQALALIGLHQYEEAVAPLDQAINLLLAKLSVAYSNLAVAKFEANLLDEALSAAQLSVNFMSTWCGGWINTLMVHCEREDSEGVKSIAENLKRSWPAWCYDPAFQERLQNDVTLRYIRVVPELHTLFSDALV